MSGIKRKKIQQNFVKDIKKWIEGAEENNLGFLYNQISDEMEKRGS